MIGGKLRSDVGAYMNGSTVEDRVNDLQRKVHAHVDHVVNDPITLCIVFGCMCFVTVQMLWSG